MGSNNFKMVNSVQILGWLSTIFVLIGYFTNSIHKPKTAMVLWIIGDIGWIIYDFCINNFSHLFLSSIIITINIYGIFRILKSTKYGTKN